MHSQWPRPDDYASQSAIRQALPSPYRFHAPTISPASAWFSLRPPPVPFFDLFEKRRNALSQSLLAPWAYAVAFRRVVVNMLQPTAETNVAVAEDFMLLPFVAAAGVD